MKSRILAVLMAGSLLAAMIGTSIPAAEAQGTRNFFQPIGKDGQTNASVANPLPTEREQVAQVISFTVGSTQTTAAVATGLKNAINASTTLLSNYNVNVASASSNVLTIKYNAAQANVAYASSGSTTAVVANTLTATSGLLSQTVTLSTNPTTGDVVTLTFTPAPQAAVLGVGGNAASASNPVPVQLSQGNAAASITNAVPVIVGNSTISTYAYSQGYVTPVATPTDVLGIVGSATKTVKIQKIVLNSTQTTAGVNQWFLIKRSTADTGSTPVALTAVPLDSTNAAATAVVQKYTATNPTTGTAVGTIVSMSAVSPAPAGTTTGSFVLFDAKQNGQPIVLRGVAQELDINFGGAAVPTGLSASFDIQTTEE